MFTGSQMTLDWNDWMEHITFDSVCCWALPLNDCRKHQNNDHFPSFKSERLVARLTTPPLMDLRILLLVLKCITINVIWDTQSMTCLPGDQHGHYGPATDSERISWPGINFLWKILLRCRKLPAERPLTRDFDVIMMRDESGKCLFSRRGQKVCV